MDPDETSIFFSYASPDRDRIVPFVSYLEAHGFEVWVDFKRLKPGQSWDFEIRRALDKASIVIVFISNNSVDRRGYAQREIRLALEKFEEKLYGDIYIIPVLLDDDAVFPRQLATIQYVRANEPDSDAAIAEAIRFQRGEATSQAIAQQQTSALQWSRYEVRESWDGLPGYAVECSAYTLSSSIYQNISDINAIIRAKIVEFLMSSRTIKYNQAADFHNFGQPKYSRTNTLDVSLTDPVVQGETISIGCSIHSYFTGAAHGNIAFETFVFMLDPVVQIESLESVFSDSAAALVAITRSVREQLLSPRDEDELTLDAEWVENGIGEWSSYTAFRFVDEGIDILFSPYQVAAYALGVQSTTVPYSVIRPYLLPEYASALGISHLS